MKILLVKPKARLKTITSLNGLVFLEPLELGYVAAAVPGGHDTRVLDLRLARWPNWAFARSLKRYWPDVVGISGYSHEANTVKDLCQRVKRILPKTLTVVGGHHATVLPEDYNCPGVDAIVRGEGCAPFRAIVESVASGRDLRNIPNVLVPGGSFDTAAAAQMPRYPELSEIPAPRRDLWDARRYRCFWPSLSHPPWQTLFPPVALARSSFGCTMNCSFCVVPSLSGRRRLTRSVQAVVDEIASLNVDHVYFCDDETFLDPRHAMALAEAIERRGLRKRYFAWSRSTTVDRWPEVFQAWRRIGLDAVFLGFEATTDTELAGLSKHATVADNERALATLTQMGIAVQTGFMVNAGFTREDFARLTRYVQSMPPAQITFTVYTPSPGSPAWREERTRYVCKDLDLHDCMHPMTPTVLPLKEFFERFSALVGAGAKKNPLRRPETRFPLYEIPRIIRATTSYSRALRKAYRDYPQRTSI